jgi:hypothetical protein
MVQQQLASCPSPIDFYMDPDEFSSSTSTPPSPQAESKSGSSHSQDSATINTATTDISSSISQPEPITTSSPAKCPPESPPPPNLSAYGTPGLKIVIDNIDKTVRPRDQRIDAQSKSLHYVQAYAVKDRIDYSKFSNKSPPPGKSVYDLLPCASDYQVLKDNFAILVARVLVKHVPYFQDFKGLVPSQIPHQFSSEMAKESEIVSKIGYAIT